MLVIKCVMSRALPPVAIDNRGGNRPPPVTRLSWWPSQPYSPPTHLCPLKNNKCMTPLFVPNRHGMDISVRCMWPYDEYSQFTPNPEGGARSNATLFDNRQQKNSKCRDLRTWKQSPLDSDHLLILNASLTKTDNGVFFKGLCTQLFAKWGFVLVYPTSLI